MSKRAKINVLSLLPNGCIVNASSQGSLIWNGKPYCVHIVQPLFDHFCSKNLYDPFYPLNGQCTFIRNILSVIWISIHSYHSLKTFNKTFYIWPPKLFIVNKMQHIPLVFTSILFQGLISTSHAGPCSLFQFLSSSSLFWVTWTNSLNMNLR